MQCFGCQLPLNLREEQNTFFVSKKEKATHIVLSWLWLLNLPFTHTNQTLFQTWWRNIQGVRAVMLRQMTDHRPEITQKKETDQSLTDLGPQKDSLLIYQEWLSSFPARQRGDSWTGRSRSLFHPLVYPGQWGIQ